MSKHRSFRIGGHATTKTKATAVASREAKARTGAIVQIVREASPTRIARMLHDLVATGDIETDDIVEPVEEVEDADLQEIDTEVDLSDDDELEQEVDSTSEITLGDASLGESNPFLTSAFELVVENGICRLCGRESSQWRSLTPTGREVLEELENRETTLGRIADWLSESRREFLIHRDLWWLGASALNEVKSGLISVQQKSLIKCAGLSVREETLSRYIRETRIVWPDATCSLDVLFCKNAQYSWVANSVGQFLGEIGEKVDREAMMRLRLIQGKRGGKERTQIKAGNIRDLDLSAFVRHVNMMADTKWSDVLDCYLDRMSQP